MDKRARRILRLATPRQKKAAELLGKGATILDAMTEAGYSPNVARQGLASVPDVVLALMPQQSNLVELGRVNAETRIAAIRGRLLFNTLKGQDGGAASAKILGSDKELAMWQSETNVNQVIVQMPDVTEEK